MRLAGLQADFGIIDEKVQLGDLAAFGQEITYYFRLKILQRSVRGPANLSKDLTAVGALCQLLNFRHLDKCLKPLKNTSGIGLEIVS